MAPPPNCPPYEGIKGQPLRHGSKDGRRQTATPTVDVTGVPSADSGHRSAIPDAVAGLWDLRRGTRQARHCSRHYAADTDHSYPPPTGEGSGDATCPSKRGAQHAWTEPRISPLEESGTSTRPPDLLVCTPALRPGGPGPPRAPPPLEHAGPWPAGPTERHVWRTDHPTATTTPPAWVGRRSARSSQNQGQNPGRQRRAPPSHSVLPTVSNHCTPRFRGKRRLTCPTHVHRPSL